MRSDQTVDPFLLVLSAAKTHIIQDSRRSEFNKHRQSILYIKENGNTSWGNAALEMNFLLYHPFMLRRFFHPCMCASST